MTLALVLLAILGLTAVSPVQANIIYSNNAAPINGDITPALGSVPSFTTVVTPPINPEIRGLSSTKSTRSSARAGTTPKWKSQSMAAC